MKQLITSAQPARLRNLRTLAVCVSASAFAMACSFGSVEGEGTQAPEDTMPVAGSDGTTDVPETTAEAPAPGAQPSTDPVVSPVTPSAAPAPAADLTPMQEVMGADYVETELDRQALAILEVNCASCHQSPAALGNFGNVLDVAGMVDSGMIVAGDPIESPLMNRMTAGNMPPAYIDDQRPSTGDLDTLKQWISNITFGVQECDALPFTTLDDTWEEIQRDFNTLDAEDKPFARYLTATYASNAGVCGNALQRQRYALTKAINSVSIESRVVEPYAIDANETIYRVDIRDYGFDRELTVVLNPEDIAGQIGDEVTFTDAWEAIVGASGEYGVEYTGDQADQVKAEAGTLVPMLPINVFVQFTQIENTYYELINGPQNLIELEAQLGIDAVDNFDRGRLWRAGFTTSGVSKQERVLTRQEQNSAGLSYWLSFDFEDGVGGNESIFADPIDFEFVGGEAIYSLPNGLQAYYVAAANGQRLVEAPAEVVVDPAQNNGIVTNAASCHSCHQAGLIPFTDMVRSYVLDNAVSFSNDDVEDVERLYPLQPEFDALAQRDSEVFVSALERAGIPRGTPDAISNVFLTFQLGPGGFTDRGGIDARTIAGELGVTLEQFEREISRLDPDLASVSNGGVMDRERFTGVYFDTLCLLQASSNNAPANCQ